MLTNYVSFGAQTKKENFVNIRDFHFVLQNKAKQAAIDRINEEMQVCCNSVNVNYYKSFISQCTLQDGFNTLL